MPASRTVGAAAAVSGPRKSSAWLIEAGHLAALWGLAVVEPTLSVLGREDNLAYFVPGRRVDGAWFGVLALLLALLPPLVMVALEALAGRIGEAVRRRLHAFFIWTLASLLALYALEQAARSLARSPNGAVGLLLAAAAIGALFAAAYVKFQPVRGLLTVLSVTPLVSLAAFVLTTPGEELVFGAGSSTPPSAVPSHTPVLVLIWDELPVATLMGEGGKIDAARYPNFAKLAADATWFRNDFAAAESTVQAVPAILTGKLPPGNEVPVHTSQPHSLFTLLGNSHEITALEHATWLCPRNLCGDDRSRVQRSVEATSALSLLYASVIVPRGVYARLGASPPDPGRTWGEALGSEDQTRSVGEILAATGDSPSELARYPDANFARFLGLIKPYAPRAGRAPFYFLHAPLPHGPRVFLPDGKVHSSWDLNMPGVAFDGLSEDLTPFQFAWQRHVLQTRYTDLLLGRLLRELRDDGLYDRALILVTADHGVSFMRGEAPRTASPENAAGIAMVPLFIKRPHQREGRVLDRAARATDVLPTVADLLDTRLPWNVTGTSLFGTRHRGGRTVSIGRVTSTSTKLERQRTAIVRRQTALFGIGLEGGGGFGLGAHGDLVGRRVTDVGLTGPAGPSATLSDDAAIRSADPRSRWVPAGRVNGSIDGRNARRVTTLAVAVNGRIAGVGPTYRAGNRTYFSLMASDRFLRRDGNAVGVYEVVRRRHETGLRPLTRPPAPQGS
jgi:hypothetical protein